MSNSIILSIEGDQDKFRDLIEQMLRRPTHQITSAHLVETVATVVAVNEVFSGGIFTPRKENAIAAHNHEGDPLAPLGPQKSGGAIFKV